MLRKAGAELPHSKSGSRQSQRLPTAAGTSATAAPTAKTAESSASTSAPTAGAAAETSTPAEHATDHGANPPAASAARAAATAGRASEDGAQDMKDDENQEENRPDGERGRALIARLHWLSGLRGGERNTLVSGDVVGELPGARLDTRAVISLAEKRDHGAAGVASSSIVDDRLEAVADFGAIFVFERGDEKEDAATVFFPPTPSCWKSSLAY